MNLQNLSVDKQNEFAFKGKMMLEIEKNLLMCINDINLTDEKKKKEYKVQLIYNADELEKYCKLLSPYQENENVKKFFDAYNNIKENMDNAVKMHSTKEILKEVKKFRAKIEELAQEQAITKMLEDVKEGYGLEGNDVKVIKAYTSKSVMKNFFPQMIAGFILQIILMISFSGLFNYCTYNKNFFSLVFFVLYFSSIEFVLKLIIGTLFQKLIFKTMGLIMLVPFIASVVIAIIFPIFVGIESIWLFLLAAVVAFGLRKFMLSYLFEKISERKKKNKKGDENAR